MIFNKLSIILENENNQYITFISNNSFSVVFYNRAWNGTVQYSYDSVSWSTWDGSSIQSLINDGKYYLYFRGYNNNKLTNYSDSSYSVQGFKFIEQDVEIECHGNIETLLDYRSVESGLHPTMARGCFCQLFSGCYQLITAPSLQSPNISNSCYKSMFSGCTSLIAAPYLPGTNTSSECYAGMFSGCTSLKYAPDLLAESINIYSYYGMFLNCTSLEVPPRIMAKRYTYEDYSMVSMFSGCTSLKYLPKFSLSTFGDGACANMFRGCSNIKLSETITKECKYEYRIPFEGTGTSASDSFENMFSDTGGSFTGTPEINKIYYTNNIPDNEIEPYITFYSDSNIYLSAENTWDGTLEYSTDSINWHVWDGSSIQSSENDSKYYIYLRGIGNTIISGTNGFNNHFHIVGSESVSCKGNIEMILDYKTAMKGRHPVMGDCCFKGLFAGNTQLISSPILPSIDLSTECYMSMFYGCSNLNRLPSLPSENLSDGCYSLMFQGCTSVIYPTCLPSTLLYTNCYLGMFIGCTNLLYPPDLPATELADKCYREMFFDCTSLLSPPSLPATTLYNECYFEMFNNCTSLTDTPLLPATNLDDKCYYRMFRGCNSISSIPEIQALIFPDNCCCDMFYGCDNIKLSSTQSLEYPYEYRIPHYGNGTSGISSFAGMFSDTGGTFTGSPSINTTYYTNIKHFEPVSWSSGNNAQITKMIEAADAGQIDLSDYWSVGETRFVNLYATEEDIETGIEAHSAQTVELIILDFTCTGFTVNGSTPHAIIGIKECLLEPGQINSTDTSVGGWRDSKRRIWCNTQFKNSLPNDVKSWFKQFKWSTSAGGSTEGLNTTFDYFALPTEKCVFSYKYYSRDEESDLYEQWQYYTNTNNRIKHIGSGNACSWWTSSQNFYYSQFCYVSANTSIYHSSTDDASDTYYLSPFGCI